jgi:hypothetical protein
VIYRMQVTCEVLSSANLRGTSQSHRFVEDVEVVKESLSLIGLSVVSIPIFLFMLNGTSLLRDVK